MDKKRNRVRKKGILIYLSEDELKIIDDKMKRLGTKNRSAFARKMLIDGVIVNIDYSAYRSVAKEVNAIGVNINQITKRMHETGNLYAEDIAELNRRLNEIWQLLRSLGLEQTTVRAIVKHLKSD